MCEIIKKQVQEFDIKSLTTDKFARHSKFGVLTYFCSPGKPWQKGAIDHFNGMIRMTD